MFSVNRTAIVVIPKQPLLDWLNREDTDSGDLTLANIQNEPTVYLIKQCDGEREVRDELAKVCGRIFEEQLNGWLTNPECWPEKRTPRVFHEWFEWSWHTVVIDLARGPLVREDF
jgi:hypothetical protein